MNWQTTRFYLFRGLLALGLLYATVPLAAGALPSHVRVRLFEAHPAPQTIKINGPLRMTYPTNKRFPAGRYEIIRRQGALHLRDAAKKKVLFHAARLGFQAEGSAGIGIQANRLAPRRYRGKLAFQDDHGKLALINEVTARDYVAIVVASETVPGWPMEALKAQAVLTQARLARYKPGDSLGDSTQSEAYLGNTHRRPEVDKAVDSVWGQDLTVRKLSFTPFYHASCAGGTSDQRFFQPDAKPSGQSGAACPYCRMAPFSKPTERVIQQQAFQKAFGPGLPSVLKADSAGRPMQIQFQNGKTLSGYAFWLKLGQRFGWDKAPGTRLAISRLPRGDYRIRSTGAGHGVGLCQWGAAGMAHQGKTYREILRFYFPQARLSSLK